MTVKVSNLSIDNGSRLTLISGPCVIESKDLIHDVAGRIKEITDSLETVSYTHLTLPTTVIV